MAHSRPVSPLLLHHQDSGPPVHEGQGAVQHVQDPDSLQPAPDTPQCLDMAQNCQLLAHRQVQLALSACGLLRFLWCTVCIGHDLVVFLLKVHWLLWFSLLFVEKEMVSSVHTPCDSSWNYASHCLVWGQMGWRRAHYLCGLPQYGSPCVHVFLLFHVQFWTKCSAISMVEKISDNNAACTVCYLLHPCHISTFHWVWFSQIL